ncbi:hypothetical protein FQZ97_809340 [compost metagenome]
MTTSPVTTITDEQLIELDCCDEYSLRHMHGEVGLLIDSYRALLAEKAELRRDAERLDFLANEGAVISSVISNEPNRFRLEWPDLQEHQREWFPSPRAAIDAAIAAARGES